MADSYPVDALVLWVDGDDPVLNAKRNQYLSASDAAHDDVAGATRYKSVGEIQYCIASLLRFAPFVRKIFIVTDGQDPRLGEFIARNFPDTSTVVETVDHRVIFRGYEDALPVFNSRAIEAVMWNIPDLSEHFIYLNDDFMLVRPVTREDFFREGDKVVCYGSWFWAPFERFLKWIKPRHKGHKNVGFKDSMLRALDLSGGGSRFIHLGHSPRALLKSWFAAHAAQHPDMIRNNIRYRFRSPMQYQAQEPFYLDMARQGRCEMIPDSRAALYFKKRRRKNYVSWKLDAFDRDRRHFCVCFNALDYCTPSEQQQVKAWLEKRIGVEGQASMAAAESEPVPPAVQRG